MNPRPKAFLTVLLLSLLLVIPVFGTAVQAAGAEQAQLAVPLLVVNTSFLHVRSGPGAQYTALVTVVGGAELPVLGIASDRVWYLVATQVGNGWVNIEYTLPRGDFSYVPLIDISSVANLYALPNTPVTIALPSLGQGGGAPYYQTDTVERFRAHIIVDSVNLRSAPSDSAGVIAVLFRNDALDYPIVGRTVDSRNLEWLSIVVPDKGAGWVEAAKIHLRLSACYKTVMTIVGEVVGMTRSPGVDSTGMPVLVGADEVWLLNIGQDGSLIQVETAGGVVGWIPFSAAEIREGTPTDNCPAGSGVYVPPPGQGGGASPLPTLELPIAIVNTGNLNIRSGPAFEYDSIAVVPGGTRLTVLGYAPDMVWYLVQGDFGQGWINGDYVIFRGNLDNAALIQSPLG